MPRASLEVQGIVSGASGEPLVQIRFEGGVAAGQLTPDEARQHAQLVVEAASNAVYEAALFRWATEKFGLDERQAATMVDDLRDFRRDKWGAHEEPVIANLKKPEAWA